jgi:16S rRNA processing protein RimM
MPGKVERPAGSPSAGEPAFLAVGLVRRPHGVSGEALVEIYTDFPERLRPRKVVYVGEKHIPLTIRLSRPHNAGLLLAFDGITTPEQVGIYRNQVLYVTRADRPTLPDGEYYHDELLGFSVEDEGKKSLGILTEIMQTGANDVFVVTDQEGRELLLPAIADVLLDIDLARQKIKVHLLPGLVFEEE